MDRFKNRSEAGKKLARLLQGLALEPDVLVLALPRGGVPIAYEISKALDRPLDVFIVRKLGVPWHKELAMGAIAEGNTVVLSPILLRELGIEEADLQSVIDAEEKELARRKKIYRGNRPAVDISGKHILLVDDGIATGASMKAAVLALKKQGAKSIRIVVPVAAASSLEELSPLVDKIVCPLQPKHFNAVALWYDDFPQTQDEEVMDLLGRAKNLEK